MCTSTQKTQSGRIVSLVIYVMIHNLDDFASNSLLSFC